jgi:two-component system response regulator MprA
VDTKHILLVEDESKVASFMLEALRREGYTVAWANTGTQGLQLATESEFDLAIIDIMLPEMDGFELIKRLRDQEWSSPVLAATARDAVSDKVKGLELGADDYITKPFAVEELLARVKALLRRSVQKTVLQVGGLTLDTATRKAFRDNRQLYLSATEFRLLYLLMKHAGQPVSKETIMDEVWDGHDFSNPNSVEVYINYLRRKTEVGGKPRMIFTQRGTGYVLEARNTEAHA